jgi:hypothetical protein
MFAGALALGMRVFSGGSFGKIPPYVEGPVQTWHWQKIKNKDYARKEKIQQAANEEIK